MGKVKAVFSIEYDKGKNEIVYCGKERTGVSIDIRARSVSVSAEIRERRFSASVKGLIPALGKDDYQTVVDTLTGQAIDLMLNNARRKIYPLWLDAQAKLADWQAAAAKFEAPTS